MLNHCKKCGEPMSSDETDDESAFSICETCYLNDFCYGCGVEFISEDAGKDGLCAACEEYSLSCTLLAEEDSLEDSP